MAEIDENFAPVAIVVAVTRIFLRLSASQTLPGGPSIAPRRLGHGMPCPRGPQGGSDVTPTGRRPAAAEV